MQTAIKNSNKPQENPPAHKNTAVKIKSQNLLWFVES